MKKLFFIILFIIGFQSVKGQEKIQFTILGGYEHFSNDSFNKTAGYGFGYEFKYSFYKEIYAVTNFHLGIYNDFIPRTAIADIGEVDFSMQWKVREYKIGAGLGINLLKIKKHKIYTQATLGISKLKQTEPVVYSYKPTVKVGVNNKHYLKYSMSASVGYDYRISKSIGIGLDYTGWWIHGIAYRNTCNAKINFFF